MTRSLSKEEANEVAEDILSTIIKGLKTASEAYLRISDITKVTSAVRREGNTPDVYCKVVDAMFSRGISTGLERDREGNMVLSFRKSKKGEIAPSSELCELEWRMAELS